MFECQWNKFKKEKKIPALDIFEYHNKTIKPKDLLDLIKQGRFFGLVKVKEIVIPENKRKMWRDMNFPPLFTKVELTESEICPFMLNKLKRNNAKFPLGK